MTLIRTAAGRGYKYTLDGEPVMGVPSLTGGGLPKPGQPRWAAREAARYVVDNWRALAPRIVSGEADSVFDEVRQAPFQERNPAAGRGVDIYRHAAAFLTRGDDQVPPELYGHAVACADFLDDWGVCPLLVEAQVGSRTHKYAGTLGMVAKLPTRDAVLVSYETGSGVWPECALRAAAYRFADFYVSEDGAEMPVADLGISAAYGVHLRADGYSVHPLDAGEETFQRFLDVSAVARNAKTFPALVHAPVTPIHLLKTGDAASERRTVRRSNNGAAALASEPEPETSSWAASHEAEQ
ncbi:MULTISPECIES: hypothetical protein [unclassified Streptomyces]|uniref:hypothetical protein n=1 Tax=unclassified Streptomyces TaxID=2593676 RepID=UPI00039A6358|nr:MULTISPECIES: hypothetical protein [unclassified Streptomyces]MYT30488.1 hypothetical protein [Streptomyces sp. SID8354]